MRRVIVSNLISRDGFMAGPKGEIDWFTGLADKEFEKYAIELSGSVDTILFGRVTYQLMAGYWPKASASEDDPRIIEACEPK
jgi:dihydrofolate reductase